MPDKPFHFPGLAPYPPLALGFSDDRLGPEHLAYAVVLKLPGAEALHSLHRARAGAEHVVREQGKPGWKVEVWPTPRGLLRMLRSRFPSALPVLDRMDPETREWLGLPPASCRVPARWEVERAEMLAKAEASRARNLANRTVDLPPGKERNAYILKRKREGATNRQICREIGLNPGGIQGLLKRAKWEEERAQRTATWEQRAARLPDMDLRAIPGPETRIDNWAQNWTQDWTPQRQHEELSRER